VRPEDYAFRTNCHYFLIVKVQPHASIGVAFVEGDFRAADVMGFSIFAVI
jgi:hypothetical protein